MGGFSKPSKPKPPPPPIVMPEPDTEMLKKNKGRASGQKPRPSGRSSTILSDNSGDTLG